MLIWSFTEGQGPAGSLVINIKLRFALFISDLFKEYVAFATVLLGLKVPVPPVHNPEAAAPP
jgi:hypothetical protein